MTDLSLFSREHLIGIFRGFSEGGLEFPADLVLPYQARFQSIPMHGQFLLIQLADENEAVLGRITSAFSDGRLASGSGEDYGIRVVKEGREVPDDLREQYLKYRVNVRVLGVVRKDGDKLLFAASHRRLPHVGSKVAFLSQAVLREIAGHNVAGAELGFFALGEFIYAKGDKRLQVESWMQPVEPAVVAKFDIAQLVSKRTFIFARAGYGKSNLTKLLFSNLYKGKPTVTKRNGRQVPVGTVIFDPDGEYFWPDDKNRPGLCDVPELRDQVVVFTRRQGPSPYYQSFVAGSIKLDIRRLRPADVVSIALSPEKQDQQNVRKLKSMSDAKWRQLVDEIYAHGNSADPEILMPLLGLQADQEGELYAARANMTTIVNMLHSPSSLTMDKLLVALKEGKLCIFDVSQARGEASLQLSGLVLKQIFDHNMEEFTKKDPDSIPTIAVVEEAQSVLSERAAAGEGVYVQWVKEGRKLDLGVVLVTQQPGSIAWQILSQGDNWFLFHLLSRGDLEHVKRANSHFSDDILSSLLNEPIPGHGVFWSSAGRGKPYPLPIRVLSFEDTYKMQDPKFDRPPEETYARRLRTKYDALVERAARILKEEPESTTEIKSTETGTSDEEARGREPDIDMLLFYTQQA